MDNIPIIFIHKSNSDYLKFTLAQARYSNPGSDIYLLGDESNNKYNFIQHYNLQSYNDHKFSKIYKHLSSNNFEHELFCFERWFILYNFLHSQNITGPFFYCDSDVMLYENITIVIEKISNCDITVCNKIGPEYLYMRNTLILYQFCNYIIGEYSNPQSLLSLMDEYIDYKNSDRNIGGGICDMRFIGKYIQKYYLNYVDLNYGLEDNTIFDDNINVKDYFTYNYKKNIKEIFIKEKRLYFYDTRANKYLKVNGLHFQGPAKKYIKNYFYGKFSIPIYFDYLNSYLKFVSKKFKKLVKIIITKVLHL